ncbi:60S ribosomal export protein NMD3-like [Sycon ciliatum]|uniref:60S ribosomal export protein NMD3-like n=1 Tax=Sycon ciliatum TaxID=27933 RepID=UPI0020A85898|eukprot:scpid47673/ scgid11626/ 60S ribosomal export protein NMD3
MDVATAEAAPAEATQASMILCCQCGTLIEPNPSNMCVGCIRSRVDITEGIPKQGVIHFCRACERYLQPPTAWVSCALESRELLSVCLKRIKLQSVRLIDAGFIWTEPHSKRLKVKLSVQKEVFTSTILEQEFVVEFVIQNQMCEACHRREADDFWKAVVQVRQKARHKKTFLFLEQLILKHRAHSNSVKVKQCKDGLDFFFHSRSHAKKMVDFLNSVVPCTYKTSEQLISHDIHSNTFNYKYTFSVEIAPICKDDILCLPNKLAQSIGSIRPLVICYRVSTGLHVIDPWTLQVAEMSSAMFWRQPFTSVSTSRDLVQFTIMEIDVIKAPSRGGASGNKGLSGLAQKFTLADAWVVRSEELGVSDRQYHCRTHLGHLFNVGDTALGFDFTNANLNHDNLAKLKVDKMPDVVLVKKHFGDKHKRHSRRNWQLKTLEKEKEGDGDAVSMDGDYTDFLEDIEEDSDLRQKVNIYHDPKRDEAAGTAPGVLELSEDVPQIELADMLSELDLASSSEAAADGDTAGAVVTAETLEQRIVLLNAEHERLTVAFAEQKAALEAQVQTGAVEAALAEHQFALLQQQAEEQVKLLQLHHAEAVAALEQLRSQQQ